jgi:glutathione S-transferase
MSDLILHHYPISPFSEKVRLVFGLKGLAWKSVIIPSIMPKPNVVALTGGFRKTPFLQIGSDIYCDSALICEVLDSIEPKHHLYPDSSKGLARIIAQWADSTLFWAAMAHNLSPKGAAAMFANAPPEAAKAFGADRAAMSTGMNRLRPADAAATYKSYLRRLASMLEQQPFLLGQAPCIADFSAYHPLWFTRQCVPVMADILEATPSVLAWMDRIKALGHGTFEKMSSAEAIAACKSASPAALPKDTFFQDEHGIALGSSVTVSAETFGQEPTQGTLLADTRTRYTLRREDPRAGEVHVHFPRVGYVLRAS